MKATVILFFYFHDFFFFFHYLYIYHLKSPAYFSSQISTSIMIATIILLFDFHSLFFFFTWLQLSFIGHAQLTCQLTFSQTCHLFCRDGVLCYRDKNQFPSYVNDHCSTFQLLFVTVSLESRIGAGHESPAVCPLCLFCDFHSLPFHFFSPFPIFCDSHSLQLQLFFWPFPFSVTPLLCFSTFFRHFPFSVTHSSQFSLYFAIFHLLWLSFSAVPPFFPISHFLCSAPSLPALLYTGVFVWACGGDYK